MTTNDTAREAAAERAHIVCANRNAGGCPHDRAEHRRLSDAAIDAYEAELQRQDEAAASEELDGRLVHKVKAAVRGALADVTTDDWVHQVVAMMAVTTCQQKLQRQSRDNDAKAAAFDALTSSFEREGMERERLAGQLAYDLHRQRLSVSPDQNSLLCRNCKHPLDRHVCHPPGADDECADCDCTYISPTPSAKLSARRLSSETTETENNDIPEGYESKSEYRMQQILRGEDPFDRSSGEGKAR